VPPHLFDQAVDVLEELPRQAGFAGAGNPDHRDEVRLPLLGRSVKEFLDQSELTVAADKRGLEARRFQGSATPSDHPDRAPNGNRLGLPLELARAGLLVDDRLIACALCGLADEHGSRVGHALDAGGRVDDVTSHHPLALGADRDGRLPREDADPRPQVRGTNLLPKGFHRRRQIERGADGPLRIVFIGDRSTPHGHHGIADELLDDSAISRDQRSARVEVLRQQLAHLLGVAGLRERREPDEVGEQHRDEPPLGFRSSCHLRFDTRNPPTGKRSTALPTELHGRSIRFAAGGADLRQW